MKKCPYCKIPVASDSVKCIACFRTFNILETCFDDFENNNKWCIRFFRLIKNAPIPPRKPVPYELFSILDVTDWDEILIDSEGYVSNKDGVIIPPTLSNDKADDYSHEVAVWQWKMYEYLQKYFPQSPLLSKYETWEDDEENIEEYDYDVDSDNLEDEFEKPRKPNRRPLTQDVKDKVWNRDGGKCVECGSNEKLEFDHIIPFSKGGANTYRNIQLLCEPCNRTKSAKIG